jgi:hypothetical protein
VALFLMDNTSYFGGGVIVNPLLAAVCALLAAHFFSSWFYSFYKTGWKIDFWYFNVGLTVMIPLVFFYPLAGSQFNIPAVGVGYEKIVGCINYAFIICVIGYVGLWLGRYLYDVLGRKKFTFKQFNWFERIQYSNGCGQLSLSIISLVYGILLLGFIVLLNALGYLQDPRSYFLKHADLRPLYNGLIATNSIVCTMLFCRFLTSKKWPDLVFLLVLIMGSLFLGTRGASLYVMLSFIVIYSFCHPKKVKLLNLFLCAVSLVICALLMDAIRNKTSIMDAFNGFFLNLLYGNNFSDLRDFSWVLSYWDGEYWMGKSYLAAVISFIPREFSDFRGQWAIGVMTAKLAGLDITNHAGLRVGIFGEAFFNFGIFGVFLIGVIAGAALRMADLRIKALLKLNPTSYNSLVTPYFLAASFFITAGFYTVYVFFIFHLSLYMLRNFFHEVMGKPVLPMRISIPL